MGTDGSSTRLAEQAAATGAQPGWDDWAIGREGAAGDTIARIQNEATPHAI